MSRLEHTLQLGVPHLRAGGWEINNLSLRAPKSRGAAISTSRDYPQDCLVARAPHNDGEY